MRILTQILIVIVRIMIKPISMSCPQPKFVRLLPQYYYSFSFLAGICIVIISKFISRLSKTSTAIVYLRYGCQK